MFQRSPAFLIATTIAHTFEGRYANWECTSPLSPSPSTTDGSEFFFQPVADGLQAHRDCRVEITLEVIGATLPFEVSVSVDEAKLAYEVWEKACVGGTKYVCLQYVANVTSSAIIRIRADNDGIPLRLQNHDSRFAVILNYFKYLGQNPTLPQQPHTATHTATTKQQQQHQYQYPAMAEYLVATSIAFAFPDSSVSWDIDKTTHAGHWRVTQDGLELTQGDGDGIYEITLELPHSESPDAIVSIDGSILTIRDVNTANFHDGHSTTWLKFVTKIREGSVLSVWAKNNARGVFRGTVLAIRKLPDDFK